jgi:DNA-binding PadR family transcriptional regulator
MTSHAQSNCRRRTRNPAEFTVLASLLGGPLHGYELCRNLRRDLGAIQRIGKSQTYALLTKLERQRLVERERVGQENLPAKNVFTLTALGRRTVTDWIGTPTSHLRDMRIEFPVRLWFAKQFMPGQARELITRQLAECREKATILEKRIERCSSRIEALCYGFRFAVAQAAVAWLEEQAGRADPIDYDHTKGTKE